MAGFELSAATNVDKMFLVKHSELEGRFDPHQYHHERINAIKAIKAKNKTTNLYQLVSSTKQITTEINSQDIYIGLENIISHTGEYLATVDKGSISSAGVFKKGQILFPKLRPYLNKVHLAKFDGICSTEFHIFDAKNINAEFLEIYLRSDLIVNQTKHLMTGNTLPRLQTEDIQKLPVPLVSSEIQSKIVEFYKKAYSQKQQKEQEAQTLLNSIDGYLLNTLGITLPQQDNSLEKRMFTVPFSEMTGGSLSPDNFLKRMKLYSSSKYDFYSLDALASMYQPQTITKQDMLSTGKYKVYGANGLIGYFDKYNHQNAEVLVTCRGATCGEINLSEPKSWITGNAMVVKLNVDFVSQSYLFEILKCLDLGVVITGSAQPQITRQNLKKFSIPVPPITKQIEIADHISQIRAQAKQLQHEAAEVLATAKSEIERMILGESA